jgi:RimJ/RimL family protein N-acetyltransferase
MTKFRTPAGSRESVPETDPNESGCRVLRPDGGEPSVDDPESGSDPNEGEESDATDGVAVEKRPLTTPPRTVTDDEGREIEIRVAEGEVDALIEMYLEFEPPDRSQGTPPRHEPQIESWVTTLLGGANLNLVAWHDDLAVGHAVLVPREKPQWELAIFIRPPYQGAHIGTELTSSLMGWGRENGVESVWLSIEYYNDPALNLFQSFGFEKLSGDVEYAMEREL